MFIFISFILSNMFYIINLILIYILKKYLESLKTTQLNNKFIRST